MLKNILKFKEAYTKKNHSNINYAFEIQRLKIEMALPLATRSIA